MSVTENIILSLVFTVLRYIRKRKDCRLVNLVSYLTYFTAIICLLFDTMHIHMKAGNAVLVAFSVVAVFEILAPCLYRWITRNKEENVKLCAAIVNVHETVVSGFAFWGLMSFIFLDTCQVTKTYVVVFVSYGVGILYESVFKKNKESILEMNMLQNIALLFSGSLCLLIKETTDFYGISLLILGITATVWLILLILQTAKLADNNEGTTYWFLTSRLPELKGKKFRYKRMAKRWLNLWLPAFVVLFTFGAENSLEFYYTNMENFEFGLNEFLPYMIYLAIVISVLVSLLCTCFGANLVKNIGCVLAGIAVAGYVQVMVLNKGLENTENYSINWSSYGGQMIFNAAIWLIIVIAAVILNARFKNKFYKIVKYLMIALLIVQAAATVSLYVKAGGDSKNFSVREEDYYVSNENEFTVSEKNNVIVFVLDTFSNDFIEPTFEKYPELLDDYKDFTYYNNYDGKYDGTALAMNYLLTGVEFDNTVPCRAYAQAAYASEKAQSFYETLRDNGYTCNYYTDEITETFIGTENLYGIFDNIKVARDVKVTTDTEAVRHNIFKGAMYRCLPLLLKQSAIVVTENFQSVVTVEGRNEDAVVLDKEFYSKLQEGIEYNSAGGTYNIYHFEGMHIYGSTQYAEDSGIEEAALWNLQSVYKYIEILKDEGLYDDATIIVTADHGNHYTKDGIQPIFLIKEAGAEHDSLVIDASPVSSQEFMATIMYSIGEDYEKWGSTIYDYEGDTERERTVYVRREKENLKDILTGDSMSSYVALYGYTYKGDKYALRAKDADSPDMKLKLIDFWD